MSYLSLLHAYYVNKESYEKLYELRRTAESTRFLPIQIHNYPAFYCLCPEIYDLSAKIMVLDKQVSLIEQNLPGVALFQFARKCLIDEIKLSCDIEHVHSTRKELSDALDALETKKDGRFHGLVKRYHLLDRAHLSLNSCADIRAIYDELVLEEVANSSPDNVPDGAIFRKGLAEVTNSAQKVIHRGAYPETQIIQLMEQSLSVLNDSEIPKLVRISLFHYLFGYIHPFYDGNGRTSRFISSFLLAQEYNYLIGYRLSYTIKENVSAYYKAFQECNDPKSRGDLTPFVILFLSIICESFEKLLYALQRRQAALTHYHQPIEKMDMLSVDERHFCDVLLQASLFAERGISKKKLGEVLGLSPSTVDKRLAKLRSTILVEHKDGRTYTYTLDLAKLE